MSVRFHHCCLIKMWNIYNNSKSTPPPHTHTHIHPYPYPSSPINTWCHTQTLVLMSVRFHHCCLIKMWNIYNNSKSNPPTHTHIHPYPYPSSPINTWCHTQTLVLTSVRFHHCLIKMWNIYNNSKSTPPHTHIHPYPYPSSPINTWCHTQTLVLTSVRFHHCLIKMWNSYNNSKSPSPPHTDTPTLTPPPTHDVTPRPWYWRQ